MSRREPDDDDRRESIREKREEPYCKCGYPDMPGQCPGWRNCPMCAPSEEEE